MATLIYAANASLDGYVADKHGDIEWSAPDEEVFAFVNEFERPIGTYLYGRKMYETMAYWETAATGGEQPAVARSGAASFTSGTGYPADRRPGPGNATRPRRASPDLRVRRPRRRDGRAGTALFA